MTNIIFIILGAYHKARFMGIAIYILKIRMLSSVFKLTAREQDEIERLAEYISVFYVYAFLRCPLAASAAFNDLEFWQLMIKYRA